MAPADRFPSGRAKKGFRERSQASTQHRLARSRPTSQCSFRPFHSRFSALQSLTAPPEPTHLTHFAPAVSRVHFPPGEHSTASIRTLVLPPSFPKESRESIFDTLSPCTFLRSDYENFPADCDFLTTRIKSFTASFTQRFFPIIICVKYICKPDWPSNIYSFLSDKLPQRHLPFS